MERGRKGTREEYDMLKRLVRDSQVSTRAPLIGGCPCYVMKQMACAKEMGPSFFRERERGFLLFFIFANI